LMGIMAMEESDDAGVPDNVRLIVSSTCRLVCNRAWISQFMFFFSFSELGWRGLPGFAG
jgi:hypothetical protein